MRDVVRNMRIPGPYVMDVSETVAGALIKSSHLIAPLLTEAPAASVCICCGARRLPNGDMPCEH